MTGAGHPVLGARRAALLTFALFCGNTLAEGPTPHQLLDRMNEAVRDLDYEGRFVVQSGDQLDALHIVHRVEGGAERERVITLTGQPREIIRSDRNVACLVAGSDRHINVDRRKHGRSVSPLSGVSSRQLDKLYAMQRLDDSRVAGRPAFQLMISPRDDLRFGYRLFLDQTSGLPLRSLMLDQDNAVISQMMFVELRVDESVSPVQQDPASPALGGPVDQDPLAALQQRLAPPAWRFVDVPKGFKLNAHRRRAMNDSDGALEHFIFTDGLATVSVYVMPASGDHALPGISRFGTAKMVGRSIGNHEVLALGEVPLKTLKMFAALVEAADG